MGGLTYEAALERLQERGRFGIHLGLGRTRALLRELGQPAAGLPGRADRRDERQGQRPGPGRQRPARRGTAGRRDAQAAPRHLSRTAPDRRPAGRSGDLRPARRAGPAGCRAGRPPPRRADRVRAADGGRLPLVRRRGGRPGAWSRSAWAAGSTRPTPGTAAWPRSPTSTSTTWTGWARRSPLIAREKAAIIERGDLAVTGADGDGLAVVRRRARPHGGPAPDRPAGADPGLGPGRHRGRARRVSARPGSACAAGTRPPTSRSPTRCSTPSTRRASPGPAGTPGEPGTPMPAGPAGSS